MLRDGKNIILELIGLLVLFLSIKCLKSIEPYDQCVAAAYCKMVYGDLLRMANDKSYMEEYENGRHQLKRHFKYVACGVDQIEKNCDATLKHCILDVQKEAIDILKIPKSLIYGCEVESLPYVLFLCKNIPYWPNTTDIPNDFKTCHHSCSLILQYNQFHLANGKNQNDFPKDWNENIKQQVQYNKMTKNDPYFKGKNPKNSIKSYKDWILHSYMEANHRDQFGQYTNESDQFCESPSYVAGIIDELPTKFLCNCQIENTNYTFDDNNIYDSGFYPTKNKIIFCDNKYGPPQGSFIVGIRFLIKIISIPNHNNRLRYFIGSSYLCSGHNWSPLKNFTNDNNKDDEFISENFTCPYLTAICSMRFKRYQLNNDTSYITNIKIGCCTVPEHILYSGIPSTTEEYIPGENKSLNVPDVWIDKMLDTTTLTKSYCPEGQYIDRFDLNRLYTFLKSTLEKQRYIGVMRNIFYCNNLDKNDQTLLDDTLYEYLYFNGNGTSNSSEIHPTDYIGKYECSNGFFTRGTFEFKKWHMNGPYYKYIMSYKLWCSETYEYIGGTWNSDSTTKWIHDNIYFRYTNQEYFFRCPEKYAICGIHSYASYVNTKGHSYITLHGRTFKFICCPILPFLLSRDCGPSDGLILDVEKTKQYGDCGEIQGGDTKCEVSYTIGYEENNYEQRKSKSEGENKKIKILEQFGITKHDMLTIIINSRQREIGDFATKLSKNISFIEDISKRKYIKSSSSSLMTTKKSITIELILEKLSPDIIPIVIDGLAIYIKPPEDDDEKVRGGSEQGSYESASFIKSITTVSKNTTKQIFTVYNGHKTFFYDVFLKCGSLKIYSDTNIRYIRPTLECTAIAEMEFIGQYNNNEPNSNNHPINKTFIAQGYGLYIDAAPRHGLVSNLNWVHITSGVKELFENNPRLVLQGNGLNEIPFSNTKNTLWESYNPRIIFNTSVTFNISHVGYIYRIFASCGKYKVYTDKFLLVIGHKDKLDLSTLPRARASPYIENPPPKYF